MPSPTRILLVVLLLAGIGSVLAVGWWRTPQSVASAGGWTNTDCRQCHAEVWQEWESSGHARAWTGDAVQAMFQHFGHDRKCESCHAPEPIFLTGLDQPPALRADDVTSGVNCLSCHATAEARSVAATRDLPTAPCQPRREASLSTNRACAGCHVAIDKDWTGSRYAAEGKTCQTCHMPQGQGTHRSHVCAGAYDDALIRSGARLEARLDSGELLVRVTNHATGHNFPGERHNRSLLVQVMQYDAAGNITLARQELIKGITPFRGETSVERLKIDESFEVRFPLVAPGVTADVQLLYKRFPWQADREALVVHRQSIQLTSP